MRLENSWLLTKATFLSWVISVRGRYSRPYYSKIDFSTMPPSTLRSLCGPLPCSRQRIVLQLQLGQWLITFTEQNRHVSYRYTGPWTKMFETSWTMGSGCDIYNYEISYARQGYVKCFCDHSTKPSGSIICGAFSWLAEQLLAPQEGLCCMELVIVVVILGASFAHLSFRQIHCVYKRQHTALHGTVCLNKVDRQLGTLFMVTAPLHFSDGWTRRSRQIDSVARSPFRDHEPLFQSQN
jgi:hypothetical protein